MVDRLRDRGGTGLVTALGWYLTKHAAGVYGADPPPQGLATGRHRRRPRRPSTPPPSRSPPTPPVRPSCSPPRWRAAATERSPPHRSSPASTTGATWPPPPHVSELPVSGRHGIWWAPDRARGRYRIPRALPGLPIPRARRADAHLSVPPHFAGRRPGHTVNELADGGAARGAARLTVRDAPRPASRPRGRAPTAVAHRSVRRKGAEMSAVERERRGHVEILTINRPEARNAINGDGEPGHVRASWTSWRPTTTAGSSS